VAALNSLGCALGVAGGVGLAGIAGQAPSFVRYMAFGFVIPAVYLAGVTAVAAVFARDQPAVVRARVPAVLATMHMCWGAGFLTSPRRLIRPTEKDGNGFRSRRRT
jgi:hypothetical protein